MPRPLRTAALALVLTPALLLAQQPRALPAPDVTFEEPFSAVSGLRELSDGRVIVADARDKVLQLIDFKAGSATKIGREGSGPGEFGLPFRLYGVAGDTTFLFDPGNTRYLLIGPDGKPGKDFRLETNSTGPGGGVRIGFAMARTSDSRGRLYYETQGFSPGPDGRPMQADSVPVLRYDRATQKSDTMGFVKLAPNTVQVSGTANNQSVRIGGANPLAPRDEWTVFPDGRIAIVRANPFRVDWVMANGAKSSAPAFRYSPIKMTAADIKEEEALRARNQSGGLRMSMTAGPEGTRTSASVGGPAGPPPAPLTDWPEVKPPFRSGQASIWARPNGELWIRRTEPAGAKGTLYDIVSPQGVVLGQVRLEAGVVLVGFGNGTVYTTKADEDDLLYLQRHRVPEQRLIGN